MNIPEKINAFIEETGEETTRLLATKFVADEAVGLVGELVAALTQLHTVSSTIFPPENEKVPLLWRMAIQQAAAALAKAAQFTAAITSTAPTVGGETEPLARETPKRPRTFQEKHGRPASANTPTVGGETETQIFPPVDAVALLWRMAIQQAAAALAKAAQFTAAIAPTAPTVGGATETQIFPPQRPE